MIITNHRVKQLRKTLGLTLEKFGERVGVGKTAISRLENGSNGVTDQMFKSICREFNVNEEWLRNGTGEMFKQLSPNNKHSELSDIKERILGAVTIMSDDDAQIVWQMISTHFSNNSKRKEVKN